MSPKTTSQDGPFLFDWDVEDLGRSVRLHQSLGPDDMTQMRLRPRPGKCSLAAFASDPTIVSLPTAVGCCAGPDSAALEQRMARGPAGPKSRPPPGHRHSFPTITINRISIPTIPPDKILSSSQPRSNVPRVFQLTGTLSATTSLSTDTSSLHKSTQKIRQLTGLDLGPRRASESQLQTSQQEAAIASSEVSSSLYSHEILKDMSCEPAKSTYLSWCEASIPALSTPHMTAPRSLAPMPLLARYYPAHTDSSGAPVREALPLGGGVIAADVRVTMPEQRTPSEGRRESWYADHSDQESHSSSSSEVPESEFELEPTAAELYHDSAVAIAKNSPHFASSGGDDGAGGPSSRIGHIGWDSKYQNSDTVPFSRSRDSTQGSISSTVGSTLSHSPSTPRPFAFNPFRKRDTLSERRGHIPSPLDDVPSLSSSRGIQPQRTPYPLVSSSVRATVDDAAEDGQSRSSLLARLFTGGNGSSANMGKRDSTGSGGSGRAASVASAPVADKSTPTTSTWSPDTPSPGGGTFGEASRNSAGLLAWTMDHARHAAGRKSKADKAETKRGSLKEKIKVLRGDSNNEPIID